MLAHVTNTDKTKQNPAACAARMKIGDMYSHATHLMLDAELIRVDSWSKLRKMMD
jgi:hypothetical protein